MDHGVRLTLAYDGTDFAGFQVQPDTRTIQAVLEHAIQQITQHPVRVRGASRTDAGVHAEGQVVAFSTSRQLPPRRWLLAINRYLPDDVAVQDVAACEPDYNPRFDALEKTYRYLFHLGVARDPLHRHRAWHLGRHAHVRDNAVLSGARLALDLAAMQRTCELFVGTHDFRAFRSADDIRDNSRRTLYRMQLWPEFWGQPNHLALEVTGSAFMKQMVRIMAGALIAVGRGNRTPEQIAELLRPGQSRDPICETAPAAGLTLLQIKLGRIRAQASHSAP
jgi:tRNA pseudouridine38-40 synthase